MSDNKEITPNDTETIKQFIEHLAKNPSIIDEIMRRLQEEKSEPWDD